MKKFEEMKFTIPALKGISTKNIEEHLKLYSGYVKNANLVIEKVSTLSADLEKNAYEIGELQRRFGFEFDGMRNHEIYFKSLEGSAKEISEKSELYAAVIEEFGSFEAWLGLFKQIAKTRGIGWAVLYFDPISKRLMNAWLDEQHLGQLNGATPVLMLDMWEHSYVADYFPSGKAQYIADFFENLNWSVIENNYREAIK